MKKKRILWAIIFWGLFFGITFTSPENVKAANAARVKLKTGKTYTSYDVTGDKKKDKILLKVTKDSRYNYVNGLTVYINGKNAYKFTNNYYYPESSDFQIITLKNGKVYLYLYAIADNYDGPVCGLFQYKSGKLKQVVDFQTLFKGYGSHAYGKVLKVSGNTIYTEAYLMSWSIGPCYVRYNYTCKSGTLKRTSNTTNFYKVYSNGKNTRTFYANRNLTVYTSTAGTKKAYTIPKKAKITIDKCYTNGKTMMIRVKYKGKYGWLKPTKSYKEQYRQFSNTTLAG